MRSDSKNVLAYPGKYDRNDNPQSTSSIVNTKNQWKEKSYLQIPNLTDKSNQKYWEAKIWVNRSDPRMHTTGLSSDAGSEHFPDNEPGKSFGCKFNTKKL